MARTLNKVQLIGRLGADPELRHTGTGVPVASFSIATNRQWPDKEGNLREETEWHSVVAWDRLAQICSEHLTKGRLVYVEGRLQTRSWDSNGQKQYRTEIVAGDMLLLDSKPGAGYDAPAYDEVVAEHAEAAPVRKARSTSAASTASAAPAARGRAAVAEVDPDDLPF